MHITLDFLIISIVVVIQNTQEKLGEVQILDHQFYMICLYMI